MQVYEITPTSDYTYGCALVAADSIERAINFYCKDEYNDFIYTEYLCTCNIVPKLEYDTTYPAVILNTIGCE